MIDLGDYYYPSKVYCLLGQNSNNHYYFFIAGSISCDTFRMILKHRGLFIKCFLKLERSKLAFPLTMRKILGKLEETILGECLPNEENKPF